MARQPDGAELGDLARRTPRLRRWALFLARDPDLAADLVQETLIAASAREARAAVDVDAWLAGVLRNHYRMWCRTTVRRREREATASARAAAFQVDEVERREAARLVAAALGRLPVAYAETLRLRYFEELEPDEIARRLGLPASSVRRRCTVGLRLLRAELERTLGDDERGLRLAVHPLFAPLGWLRVPRVRPRARPLFASPAAPILAGALALVGVVLLVQPERSASPSAMAARPTDAQAAVPRWRADVQPAAEAVERSAPAPLPAPACTGSLQALVDATAPGGTVVAPACVWRESLTIDKPLTLLAELGAEIRGSDVVAAFAKTATGWRSRHPLPASIHGDCPSAGERACRFAELVFRDGARLESARHPTTGQFAIDGEGHLVLPDDPTDHVIEVAVRSRWVHITGNDVVVSGFRMRHAVGAYDERPIEVVAPARHAVIVGNVLSDAAGGLVRLTGSDHVVRGNMLGAAGGAAVVVVPDAASRPASRIQIVGNRIERVHPVANTRTGWDAAGVKLILAEDARVEGNDIRSNAGAGVFCVSCNAGRIAANRIYGNTGSGIIALRTVRSLIEHNQVVDEGAAVAAAIRIFGARGTIVSANTLLGHKAGIELSAEAGPLGTNNAIDDNVLLSSQELGIRCSDARSPWFADAVLCEVALARGNRVARPHGIEAVLPRGLAWLPDGESERLERNVLASLGGQ